MEFAYGGKKMDRLAAEAAVVTAVDEIVDRLQTRGAAALTEAELLATLLHRGLQGDLPLVKARDLLDSCGGLQGLLTCDPAITQAPELNRLQRVALLSAVELSRRLARIEVFSACLEDQRAAARYIHLVFGRVSQIVLGAVFLDVNQHPVGQIEAFHGVHNQGAVEPRPILREAIRRNAHSILLFNAHPSGDPTPTKGDFAFAARMRDACPLVDLELLDYLVLAGERWTSVRWSTLASCERPPEL